MPIPKPNNNESHENFVDRCMADGNMQEYEPDQRRAICEQSWKDSEKTGVSHKGMTRAFEVAAGQPWAIEERNLSLILDIAQRTHEPDFQAVALAQAERVGELIEIRDRVAVINVIGPIFRYANLFTRISGATSTEALAAGFGRALGDSSIDAILFNIDSPGGEMPGISELAQSIAAGRSQKRIWAYVDDLAASGAYWLASATERIIASDTSRLGSIGVIATVKESNADPAEGKTYQFISSVSPHKRLDLETEEDQRRMQEIVDDLGQVFVRAVAGNRGISEKQVLDRFGRGFLRTAAKAVEAGMADEIGSFEKTLADLGRQAKSKGRSFVMEGKTSTAIPETGGQKKETVQAGAASGSQEQTAAASEQAAAAAETKTESEQTLEYAASIAELCVLAGELKRAAEFIRAHTSIDDARKSLMNTRAEADEKTDIQSRVLPESGAAAGARNPKESLIVKAAEKLAAESTK